MVDCQSACVTYLDVHKISIVIDCKLLLRYEEILECVLCKTWKDILNTTIINAFFKFSKYLKSNDNNKSTAPQC
jgi:hypothetical protein